jgi:hypothetical protein
VKQQRAITHDDEQYSLTKQVKETNYIELARTEVTPLSWIETTTYFRLYVSLSLDVLETERTDYSLVNLIGDFGAFFMTLLLVGRFVCFQIAQIDVLLYNDVINAIFRKKDYKSLKTTHIDLDYRNYLISFFKKILCLRH